MMHETVAVIDSGVKPISDRILPGLDFSGSGDPRGWRDDCGHGTAVARDILAIAPLAWIVPVRIMDRYGALEKPEYLENAFEWISGHFSELRIRTVCAAFGDSSYSQRDEQWRGSALQRILVRLRAAGVGVISAAGNWYAEHRRRNPQGMAWPAILREIVSAGELERSQDGLRLTPTTLRLHVSCGTGCATTIFAESGMLGETSGSAAVVAGHMAILRMADPEASVDTLVARLVAPEPIIDHRLSWPTLNRAAAAKLPVRSCPQDSM